MKRFLLIVFVCAGALNALAWGGGRPIWTGDVSADLFNEHLNKGLHAGITMSVDLPLYAYGEEVMTLKDSIDENKIAGYVYNGYAIMDSAELDTAFMWLNKGIEKFPNRLDLYLGKATAQLYCLNVEAMLQTLEMAMKQELKNKGKWLWTHDEKLDKDYDILFDRIQEDLGRFLQAEDLDNAERLARMAMKYFPKRAEYVNDLGNVYIYRDNPEEGLKYFKQALKMKPEDELIKKNIEYIEQVMENL